MKCDKRNKKDRHEVTYQYHEIKFGLKKGRRMNIFTGK